MSVQVRSALLEGGVGHRFLVHRYEMKKYLVGGAVRDRLLGLPVKERDWVVVGETPEAMLARGYRPVGKDFPVFLHPETHEEHALARTERKTGPGYRGFSVNAAADVSLEQDLLRRDLTINAMAEDEAGHLIDPFGGRRDLEARLFRHVSPAFAEDPVRILRVARLKARYAHLGFRIADETRALMRNMVDSGEVDALVPERVWAELSRALTEPAPSAFIETLRDCGALERIFPEIEALFGVPQPPRYHPEIDTGVHVLMALDEAARLSESPRVRFAVLVHDLGKGATPKERWPSHHHHETLGIPLLEAFCTRLRVPNEYKKLALKVMRYHGRCHRAFELRPATLVDTLMRLDALKARHSLDDFLLACEADAKGRLGLQGRPYPQAEFFRIVREAACTVTADAVVAEGFRGAQIGRELRRLRINEVAKAKKSYLSESNRTLSRDL